MPDVEARSLIDRLIAEITRPESVYRQRWRVGDFMIVGASPTIEPNVKKRSRILELRPNSDVSDTPHLAIKARHIVEDSFGISVSN